MLIYQDAWRGSHNKPPISSIVCDHHVSKVLHKWNWSKYTNPDKVARDVESWLNPKYYRIMNEVIVAPRQLWRDARNHAKMLLIAQGLGCVQALMKVVVGVKVLEVKLVLPEETMRPGSVGLLGAPTKQQYQAPLEDYFAQV